MKKINYEVYLVADSSITNLPKLVKEAINSGVTVVQYRNKNDCLRTFLIKAKEIQDICKEHQIPFIINDNLEAALELKSDGLHVGQEDLSLTHIRQEYKGIIGLSCQTLAQVQYAIEQEVDYVGLGSIFKSKTKPNGLIVKKSQLEKVSKLINDIPIVLIGGMNQLTINKLHLKYGYKNFAFVSYILKSSDMEGDIAIIKKIIE